MAERAGGALRRRPRPPAPAGPAGASASPQAPSPAAGDFGLRPQDLHAAYSLPTSAPTAQTIAIVDAYNDPAAEADLRTYDEAFSLPACTAENGCFKQVNQHGETSNLPFPKTVGELEAARKGSKAEAENAEEADRLGTRDLAGHRDRPRGLPVLPHPAGRGQRTRRPGPGSRRARRREPRRDRDLQLLGRPRGRHHGARGGRALQPPRHRDHGLGRRQRLSRLELRARRGRIPRGLPPRRGRRRHATETRRRQHLGGRDGLERGRRRAAAAAARSSQPPAGSCRCRAGRRSGAPGTRAVADISADADPYTGVAVSDSTSAECETSYTEGKTKHVLHWCTLGGTSLASPIVASVFALAGGSGGVSYPASTLYANALTTPSALHDVTLRLQRRMRRTLQPLHRDLGVHHRTGGGGLREPPDLPRRQRLRRAHGAGNARRPERLRAASPAAAKKKPPAPEAAAAPAAAPRRSAHRARSPANPRRARRTPAKAKAKTKKKNGHGGRNGHDLGSRPQRRPPRRRPPATTSPSSPSPSPPAPPCTST